MVLTLCHFSKPLINTFGNTMRNNFLFEKNKQSTTYLLTSYYFISRIISKTRNFIFTQQPCKKIHWVLSSHSTSNSYHEQEKNHAVLIMNCTSLINVPSVDQAGKKSKSNIDFLKVWYIYS